MATLLRIASCLRRIAFQRPLCLILYSSILSCVVIQQSSVSISALNECKVVKENRILVSHIKLCEMNEQDGSSLVCGKVSGEFHKIHQKKGDQKKEESATIPRGKIESGEKGSRASHIMKRDPEDQKNPHLLAELFLLGDCFSL